MPKKNIYDIVLRILRESPVSRNSDKKLIWNVLYTMGYVAEAGVGYGLINIDNFLKAPSFESITRARRKVQELHPELRSSKEVQKAKDLKQSKGGNFIFRGF